MGDRLMKRANTYWQARQAQEKDHTDECLNYERTEAHDALLLWMDIEGIVYQSREQAAMIAKEMIESDPKTS